MQTTKPVRARSKNKQLRIDSMTGVNPVHTHGLGIWGNPRVVMSVRVDKGLKKRFTDVSKARFGSTCNPIESFMAGVIGAYEQDLKVGVYPCNTVSIGEIKIERNLRERRKMTPEPETRGEEKKPVVVVKEKSRPRLTRKAVDYSKLSIEDLKSQYLTAQVHYDAPAVQVLAFQARKRGYRLTFSPEQEVVSCVHTASMVTVENPIVEQNHALARGAALILNGES